MKIDATLQKRLSESFKKLSKNSANAFPPPRAFSDSFEKICKKDTTLANVSIDEVTLFATGAVEMWHRATHSFLVSASLTGTSPIWESVSGYYSSHYTMRALAHALGYFHLFKAQRIVKCNLGASGKFFCEFVKKNSTDREHKSYWKLVKEDPHLKSDPLFRLNNDDEYSDVFHRSHANYSDHLGQFPMFRPLDMDRTKERIKRISKIQMSDPPIPDRNKFPDSNSVQLLAYHRLVRFRQFMDEALGASDRFWNLHREPVWAQDFLDYQAVEPLYLAAFRS